MKQSFGIGPSMWPLVTIARLGHLGVQRPTNRELLVIVFIQKAITYSCVNKIQIRKHESCSIQRIEPCITF
jgi:hypothetical protein